MRPPSLPAVAPRGKAYTVAYLSHVVGTKATPVKLRVLGTTYALLADAGAAAGRIDARLSPTVVLTTKE